MIENRTRLSRIAVASAAILAMWYGVASAESTALSVSNAEFDTSVVQLFIGKRLVAVGPSMSNNAVTYWWSDGGYSEWHRDLSKFFRHESSAETALKDHGWPEGKEVMAIVPNPVLSGRSIFWWRDGSRSDWNNTYMKFVAHEEDQGTYFKERGWPEGKKVVAVGPNPTIADRSIYWWSDGSRSDWDNNRKKFVSHEADQGAYFKERGWPVDKRLSAVMFRPESHWRTSYWWSDGSRSEWDLHEQKFVEHEENQGDWWVKKGWPQANVFYPELYEVRDVRVNEHSVGNGAIYANGRMQYKVDVKVQITDRSGNGVNLRDSDTGLNQNLQLQDLVTLYRGDKVVDTSGANLTIDDTGDYASNSWKASRHDAGYDKYLNTYQGYAEQIDGSIVELEQHENDSYPAKDGWNSYTYWVSSTEQTGPTPIRICARAGSYGANGEGYYDSCADGRNESAKLRAIVPPRYSVNDYSVTERHLGDLGMNLAENKLITVTLKTNAGIRSAIPLDRHANNNGYHCVAGFNNHWNSALGQTWNHNTALYFLPFGQENVTRGPWMFQPYGLGNPNYPKWQNISISAMSKDKINFLASTAELHAIVTNINKGTWTECATYRAQQPGESEWNYLERRFKDLTHHNHVLSGQVAFVDSYGNDGIITLSPSPQTPHKDFRVQ
ncbi:hypothetical protein L1D31_22050 [Vibrio sp. Isolate23]|uniref:hypothetical protein n=1 Tax=Vibrio sp. Isolate23 TaxID=2908533 RepID=UPI001EFC7373|nr:hypothetical protein [Vibrio sp. Isolate23]MCG9685205.1 hypothetical protein [Vibrio sp. Isolate23]